MYKKEIFVAKLENFYVDYTSEVYNRWATIWTNKAFKNWNAHLLIKTLYKTILLIQL